VGAVVSADFLETDAEVKETALGDFVFGDVGTVEEEEEEEEEEDEDEDEDEESARESPVVGGGDDGGVISGDESGESLT